VVGNPKPRSRTYESALTLADRLGGADLVVDLADHASELFDWGAPRVTELVEEVASSLVVVVASPTYKATYTGLLKVFLDRFAGGTGLRGVVVPLMLGAGPRHSLAPELSLRPLLAELGGTTVRGLYVLEDQCHDPAAYAEWLDAVRAPVSSLLVNLSGAVA
jgi:FMN reductase